MEYETYHNTPVFNDPKPCQAEGCEEGFIYTPVFIEETGETELEKEKCPWCDDYGHSK